MSCFNQIEMSPFMLRKNFFLIQQRCSNGRVIHDEPQRNKGYSQVKYDDDKSFQTSSLSCSNYKSGRVVNHRFNNSYRNIKEQRAFRGIIINHEAIRA